LRERGGGGGGRGGPPRAARPPAPARPRGIELDGMARQFSPSDFDRYDLILAMDEENRRDLLGVAPDEEARAKVRLFREFDPASNEGDLDVPDPYFGGEQGFAHVLDLVDAAARGLLDELR
jgi:protein-tyrosine phosphatase